jgi:hypothetical protein
VSASDVAFYTAMPNGGGGCCMGKLVNCLKVALEMFAKSKYTIVFLMQNKIFYQYMKEV